MTVSEQTELAVNAITKFSLHFGAEHEIPPPVMLAALDLAHHMLAVSMTHKSFEQAFRIQEEN